MSTAPRLTLYANPNYTPPCVDAQPALPSKPAMWRRVPIYGYIGLLVGVLVLAVMVVRSGAMVASATLSDATARPVMHISLHTDYLNVKPLQPSLLPPKNSLELWALSKQGAAQSLGLIPAGDDGMIGLNIEQQNKLKAAQHLGVSLELRGGSRNGQPSGPMLYRGPISAM